MDSKTFYKDLKKLVHYLKKIASLKEVKGLTCFRAPSIKELIIHYINLLEAYSQFYHKSNFLILEGYLASVKKLLNDVNTLVYEIASLSSAENLVSADSLGKLQEKYPLLTGRYPELCAFVYGSIGFDLSIKPQFKIKYTCALPEAENSWNNRFGSSFLAKQVHVLEMIEEDMFKAFGESVLGGNIAGKILLIMKVSSHGNLISKYEFDRLTILFRPFNHFHLLVKLLYDINTGYMGNCGVDSIIADGFSLRVGAYFIGNSAYKSCTLFKIIFVKQYLKVATRNCSLFENFYETLLSTIHEVYRFPNNQDESNLWKVLLRKRMNDIKLKSGKEKCSVCKFEAAEYVLYPCLHRICGECKCAYEARGVTICVVCYVPIICGSLEYKRPRLHKNSETDEKYLEKKFKSEEKRKRITVDPNNKRSRLFCNEDHLEGSNDIKGVENNYSEDVNNNLDTCSKLPEGLQSLQNTVKSLVSSNSGGSHKERKSNEKLLNEHLKKLDIEMTKGSTTVSGMKSTKNLALLFKK